MCIKIIKMQIKIILTEICVRVNTLKKSIFFSNFAVPNAETLPKRPLIVFVLLLLFAAMLYGCR